MRVLLDTHALIWAGLSPTSLSQRAREIISDESYELLVSAASAWEIAIKVRLGKLPGAEALERHFVERVTGAGYTLLAVDVNSALRAGRLSGEHKDPFDRMIAAQALIEDIAVLSSDAKLDAFGIQRIW